MKYNIGDRVEVILGGHGCNPSTEMGLVVTIVETLVNGYGGGREHGYKVSPPIGNMLSGSYNGWIGEQSFKLVFEHSYSGSVLRYKLM